MKLVEVVSGLATSPEVADALCELALNWGNSQCAASQRRASS